MIGNLDSFLTECFSLQKDDLGWDSGGSWISDQFGHAAEVHIKETWTIDTIVRKVQLKMSEMELTDLGGQLNERREEKGETPA